jgi:hypothetical protein
MPTEPRQVTLAQLVHRAVAICDPDGADDDLSELLRRLEDADQPAAGLVEGIEQRMAEEVGVLDPQEESGPLQIASAVVVYLAHRRDETEDDPLDVLRLAARAEFAGHPPPPVAEWLEEAGVDY